MSKICRQSAVVSAFVCMACSSTPLPSGSAAPESCMKADLFCAGYDYTLCVEVTREPGHCVDWSRIGATPCPRGPADCPTSLPTASFPMGAGSTPISICISKDKEQYSDSLGQPDAGPFEAGYCAAFQSALFLAGDASCSPNPCGEKGHCSLVQSGDPSLVVVECLWPL